jgi:hypothetical protein
LETNWKFGNSDISWQSDESSAVKFTCTGINARPMSPCHLNLQMSPTNHKFNWIRRSRINDDSWQNEEVPLDYAVEKYQIEVTDQSGVSVHVAQVFQPAYEYTSNARQADLGSETAPYTLSVSQISNTQNFGPAVTLQVSA